MISQRCSRLLGIFAIALFGGACQRHDFALDQIVERNTEETGGRAAIGSVRSIEFQLHPRQRFIVVAETLLSLAATGEPATLTT